MLWSIPQWCAIISVILLVVAIYFAVSGER